MTVAWKAWNRARRRSGLRAVGCGQCERTSPCAHTRHMARRLALLALLACAVALQRPLHKIEDDSYSDSVDSFWDDFNDSRDIITARPKVQTTSKYLVRRKPPKVNVTVKHKSDDKKVIKTTNINIHSHTNFIVTKPPMTHWPDLYVPTVEHVTVKTRRTTTRTTKKPVPQQTSRRPSSTRRPSKPPLRSSNDRPTLHPQKTTKKPKSKKTTCPPSSTGWMSTFLNKKVTKDPKRPERAPQNPLKGWFSGVFSSVYNWFNKYTLAPTKSWFTGVFQKPTQTAKPVTPTTEMPIIQPSVESASWFQVLLDKEENDIEYEHNDATDTKKKVSKKSLKKNYKGYQLLRTYPDAQWKVHELLDLQEEAQGSGVMWWTLPSLNGSTDLLVPPDLLEDIKDHLKSIKIDYDVVIWDLQKTILYENPRMSKKQRLELEQLRGHPMTWRRYHRYADILRYLEYLQHSHTDIVELIPLGRSFEGLPLVVVKISLPSNETEGEHRNSQGKWRLRSRMKPAVWVDGGMHAREWIGPAVATWMINTLVEGEMGKGPETEMLKQTDFYIMPVVNPDGYEHSHTHDRLWKKTRSRYQDQSEDFFVSWFPWNWGRTDCVGVDPDRNWDYHWGEFDSSKEACSENYAGPHPFSEPETRGVSGFLSENRGLIKVFLSLHAYSQSWLLPSTHGHTSFVDDGILVEMGKLATTALADMYGTKYQVGTAAEIRQPAGGMAHDWAKARAGIKFAYHVDLRDANGPYGFLLPGSQIVSTARETWQAVRAMVDNIAVV